MVMERVTVRKSRLIKGMIVPPTHLELIACDHCNLSCRYCNHASPIVGAWFADPDVVHRDFSVLAKYYRPAFVKVLGGEPLMHKHLDVVIQAARASGISDYFKLTTNGVLLHKASDAVWKSVDEVEISAYSGAAGLAKNIDLARRKTRTFGKKLTVFQYDQFRATFSRPGTTDKVFMKRIYSACKIANFWGCHAVRHGFFYKCPQSIYVPMLTNETVASDKLALTDDRHFPGALLRFLNSPEPLSTCAHCAGTVGWQRQHQFSPRTKCSREIDESLEHIVDFDWLERCAIAQDTDDDCKIPTRCENQGLHGKQGLPEGPSCGGPTQSNFNGFLLRGEAPVRQSARDARSCWEERDIDEPGVSNGGFATTRNE